MYNAKYYEIMKKNHDLFTITRNGLLGQDFHSNNGRIQVEHYRIGGGFTMGSSFYKLTIDDTTVSGLELGDVYKKIVEEMGLQ